jgi:hypothetical protein
MSSTAAVPVTIPKEADRAAVPSIVQALEKAMQILVATGQSAVIERADSLAEIATGLLEPSTELIQDRVHRMKTVRRVFEEGQWLTAEQINALQTDPPSNKSHPASDWKRRGRIFSVSHRGREYFAAYQFDAMYQPLAIVKDILEAFGEVADPWVLATWFHVPNGWIVDHGPNGARPVAPKDALDRRSDILHAAAKRQGTYVA